MRKYLKTGLFMEKLLLVYRDCLYNIGLYFVR